MMINLENLWHEPGKVGSLQHGNLFELLDEERLYEREVSCPRTQQADSKDGVNS